MAAKKRKPPKRGKGRPTLYGAELARKLCEAIETGSTVLEACRRVGIGYGTYFEWKAKNPEFAKALLNADERSLVVLEGTWKRAARKDWKASQALLRVKKPRLYAERVRVVVEEEIDTVLDALAEAFSSQAEAITGAQALEIAYQAIASRGQTEAPPAESERSDDALRPGAVSVEPERNLTEPAST